MNDEQRYRIRDHRLDADAHDLIRVSLNVYPVDEHGYRAGEDCVITLKPVAAADVARTSYVPGMIVIIADGDRERD